MEAKRGDNPSSEPTPSLAARVRAFSERFQAAEPPTLPPPSAETLEVLRLRCEGLLVAEEAPDEDAPRTRRVGPVGGERGRLRNQFELAPDARLVTNGRAVVIDANPAAAELLGLDAALLVGRSLTTFIEWADLGRFRLGLTALAREGALAVDVRLVGRSGVGDVISLVAERDTAEGTYVWGARVAPPESGIRALPGLPPALVLERLDALQEALTERERALEASERRCAELVSSLQARDLAMAVLAHELRRPMSAILGWARILRHPHLGPEQGERAVAVIEHNAHLQRVLVEALMDASRLAVDKLDLERVALDLGPIVLLAVDGARPLASAGGLGLGLFLVREIVALHGGEVAAASPGEGLGATFTVTLPLAG